MSKKKKQLPKQPYTPPSPWRKWLPVAAFIAVGILIFYPPFFRGLFFNEDMFICHIITALVFALVWADKIIRKDYTFIQSPLDWAVLAYAGAYLLSIIGAVHIGDAIYGFLRALNYFMVYWVVTQIVKDYKAYETILKILLAAGTGVAAIGILAATGYSNYPAAFDGRVILSTLQYPNTTAAYLAVLTIVGVTLWIRERNMGIKLIYSIANYLLLLVVLSTASKGAWLIFVIGAVLFLIGLPGIYKIKSLYGLGIAFIAAVLTYSKFHTAIIGEEPSKGLPLVLLGFLIVIIGQAVWEGLRYLYSNKGKKALIGSVVLIAIVGVAATAIINPVSSSKAVISEDIINEISGLTDLQNNSYTSRYDFIRWGMAIVKDYPINGTGAGGWNALYHQYQDYLMWTTEAHNHFIQVWVETGTIGFIVYLSIWILLIISVYRLYIKYKADDSKEAETKWLLIWGTAVAALALGIHAALDFDLSLSAMVLLLWTLIALISAAYTGEMGADSIRQLKPAINVTLAAILMLVILVSGSSFAVAHSYAQKGAIALNQLNEANNNDQKKEKLVQASKYYQKAVNIDSTNAEYYADLAYVDAIWYKVIPEEQSQYTQIYYNRAIDALEKAQELKPNDKKVQNSLLQTASILGDLDSLIQLSELAVKSNPNDINAYKAFIQMLWAAAEKYQKAEQPEKAKEYASRLVQVEKDIEAQKAKINTARNYWRGPKLILSSEEELSITKAHYLLGNYQEILKKLSPYAINLLALEFNDTDFEKTDFENENWRVRVVEDKEAQNGKCVEIEAKKDMQGWPTILQLASSLPVQGGITYVLEVRYKVLNCDKSSEANTTPYLGIWGTTTGGDNSKNTSFGFFKGKVTGSEARWQVARQKVTNEEWAQKRNFWLGTGSVAKGTKFRLDYISFYPVEDKLPPNIAEPNTWYAAALYKTGDKDQAAQLAEKLKTTDTKLYSTYKNLIKSASLK